MREITWDQFADAVGTVYRVEIGEGHVDLALDRASETPSAGRAGGSFRLEFLGPADPVLEQAIYPFRREEDDVFEIFIVPIRRDEQGARYEAIFY
jgi:hypothetical protein